MRGRDGLVYLDTSLLIKLFVSEAYSDEVQDFVSGLDMPTISHLCLLEWDCAMRRLERNGVVSVEYRMLAAREFSTQLADGLYRMVSRDQAMFDIARHFIEQVNPMPLRAMDALHLATARACEVPLIATADKVMADAAQFLGFNIETFI